MWPSTTKLQKKPVFQTIIMLLLYCASEFCLSLQPLVSFLLFSCSRPGTWLLIGWLFSDCWLWHSLLLNALRCRNRCRSRISNYHLNSSRKENVKRCFGGHEVVPAGHTWEVDSSNSWCRNDCLDRRFFSEHPYIPCPRICILNFVFCSVRSEFSLVSAG